MKKVTAYLKSLKDIDLFLLYKEGQHFTQSNEIEDHIVWEVELYKDRELTHNIQEEIHQLFNTIQ